jgi:site-specific DNA-cytosine methylase
LDGIVQSGVCDSACETHGVPRQTSRPAPTVPVSSHLYHAVGSAFYPRGRHGALAWEEVPLDGPANAVSCGPCGAPWIDRPSPTVSAVGEQKGSGPGGNPEKMQRASDALYLGTGRRRLTVAECAVLQDFPAGHPWQGGVGAQYRQVGNAVPPRLAEAVGRALMTAIEDVRGLS